MDFYLYGVISTLMVIKASKTWWLYQILRVLIIIIDMKIGVILKISLVISSWHLRWSDIWDELIGEVYSWKKNTTNFVEIDLS